MARSCRMFVAIATAAFMASSPLSTVVAGSPTDSDPDWLRIVPDDVGFYIEFKDLQGVRRRFRELGIWQTVRDLAQRPRSESGESLQKRPEELLGISSESGIVHILGRRSALMAVDIYHWQQGVLLVELDRPAEVRRLLRQWQATPLSSEGSVRRYRLRGGLMLAVLDQLLVLGPSGDPKGLWGRTVLLLSGKNGPHLQGRSEFAALRARLGNPYSGLVYVVWPEGDPFAVAGCRRLIFGLSFTESSLRCELHGQRMDPAKTLIPCDGTFIRSLPADTLAIWSGSFHPDQLHRPQPGSVLSDETSLIGLFVSMFSGLEQQSGALFDKLGPRATLVLGPDARAGRSDFQLPAMTAICEADDVESHVQNLDVIVGFFARLIQFMTTRQVKPGSNIQVKKFMIDDVTVHSVEVGAILAQRLDLEFLKRLEVSWAGMKGHILFSSSSSHVKAIIQAIHKQTKQLERDPVMAEVLPAGQKDPRPVEWMMIRGDKLSKILAGWLVYLQQHHPAALQDTWWQQWALSRMRDNARFGVALKNDRRHLRQAIVIHIERESPAAGILRVGDVIVRVGGKPLKTAKPAKEIAARYADRGNATVFQIEVMRLTKRVELAIPVPPVPNGMLQAFEPVRALRQLIILLRQARAVTYSRYDTTPARFDAMLQIQWKSQESRMPRKRHRSLD